MDALQEFCHRDTGLSLWILRSIFISLFSPLKPDFLTGLLHGHRECLWAQFVSGVFPALCGALPWLWEIPFPSRIDPAEPHLSFSPFPQGQARCCREVLVPEASTDPWMVSLSWECWGEQEEPLDTPAGERSRESHPAAPGAWGSPPTTFFFCFCFS